MCEIMKVYFHPSDPISLIARDESEEIDTSSITGIRAVPTGGGGGGGGGGVSPPKKNCQRGPDI